jgi:hypothetical protein
MVLIPYYFSRKYNASTFLKFFLTPQLPCLERRSIGNDVRARTRPLLQLRATLGPRSAKSKRDWPAQPTARFRSVTRTLSGVIAEPRIELPQRVRSILLIVGRKIVPIAPYFSSPHVE